jgi:hypothetical protein
VDLKPSLLEALERRPPACVVEVQARLAALFPEFDTQFPHVCSHSTSRWRP